LLGNGRRLVGLGLCGLLTDHRGFAAVTTAASHRKRGDEGDGH
jgi:hypothetical protein